MLPMSPVGRKEVEYLKNGNSGSVHRTIGMVDPFDELNIFNKNQVTQFRSIEGMLLQIV